MDRLSWCCCCCSCCLCCPLCRCLGWPRSRAYQGQRRPLDQHVARAAVAAQRAEGHPAAAGLVNGEGSRHIVSHLDYGWGAMGASE